MQNVQYSWIALILTFATLLSNPLPAFAQFKINPKLKAVGECVSEPGTVIVYRNKEWGVAGKKILPGSTLMALPGLTGQVNLAGGKAALLLEGNLPGTTPSPALESQVLMLSAKKADAELALEHGRIRLLNPGKKEAVAIKVRFLEQTWTLTLSPGSNVLMESNSTWPTGSVLPMKISDKQTPVTFVFALCEKGTADLHTTKGKKHSLTEQTIFQWNSEVENKDAKPLKLSAKVSWTPKLNAEIMKVQANMKQIGATLAKPGVSLPKTAMMYIKGQDKSQRLAGVLAAAAADSPQLLLDGVADPNHPSLRNAAVLVLRYWVSQDRSNSLRMYRVLLQNNMSESDAQIFLNILPGISTQDASRLETYESLISLLNHSDLPVRQVAYWNLIRLMPDGIKIAYDPAAAEAARAKATNAWTQFVQKKVKTQK